MQKFSYDSENDDLFIYNSKSKSSGSIELGDIILDFDNQKNLVGVQILDASEVLSDFVPETKTVIKKILKNMDSCKIETKIRNNILIIKFHIKGKEKELAPILNVPSILESSPALAYT